MIIDFKYSIETYYDWVIHVDYIGERKEKKQIVHELFNVIRSVYSDDIIIESRLEIKQTGAFLELCIAESNSIKLSDIMDLIYNFLDITGDTNEKNINKHD